jgi:succinate dehydrogenase/fumarate reductase flavoprotein subunit
MQRGPKDLIIPITYDFDMAGLVNAGYAVVSETGGGDAIGEQNSVRDRVYRGWCRADNVTQYVRKDFISKEEQFLAAVDGLKDELPDKQIQSIKTYIGQFFKILKDDNSFRRLITTQCRKN